MLKAKSGIQQAWERLGRAFNSLETHNNTMETYLADYTIDSGSKLNKPKSIKSNSLSVSRKSKTIQSYRTKSSIN